MGGGHAAWAGTIAIVLMLGASLSAATVAATEGGLSLEEKHHTRLLSWNDIQQVTLTPAEIRILTYSDSRRKLNRDREYRIRTDARQLRAALQQHLGARLIIAIPEAAETPLWQSPARLLRGLSGDDGTLTIAADRVVFSAGREGVSRTWTCADIQNLATTGPFDLTISTAEKTGFTRGSRLVRLQLKQPLPAAVFDAVWRRIEEEHGLRTWQSQVPSHQEHHQ
jgi:hypothetical protein